MIPKYIKTLAALLLCISLFISPALTGNVYAAALNDAPSTERTATNTYSFTYRHIIEPNAFTNMQILYTVGAVNFVDAVYEYNFSASFSTAGSVLTDTYTNISNCPHGITQRCRTDGTCGSNANHHKDVVEIADILYYDVPRAQDQIVVLWSDYENDIFCHYVEYEGSNQSQHLYVTGTFAMVNPIGRPVIHIMHLKGASGIREKALMSLLLAHETAHCFGAEDVYGTGPAHADDDEWNCMMDYILIEDDAAKDFYEAVNQDLSLAFCASCKSTIMERL